MFYSLIQLYCILWNFQRISILIIKKILILLNKKVEYRHLINSMQIYIYRRNFKKREKVVIFLHSSSTAFTRTWPARHKCIHHVLVVDIPRDVRCSWSRPFARFYPEWKVDKSSIATFPFESKWMYLTLAQEWIYSLNLWIVVSSF